MEQLEQSFGGRDAGMSQCRAEQLKTEKQKKGAEKVMADEGQVQECKAMLKHSWALNLSFNY